MARWRSRGFCMGEYRDFGSEKNIIITTYEHSSFVVVKFQIFFIKKAKLLANRTYQGNFHLLPLLPPSSLERFFFSSFFFFWLAPCFPSRGVRTAFISFLACTMFSLLGVSGQRSFHFGLFGLRLNRHFHRELPVNIC